MPARRNQLRNGVNGGSDRLDAVRLRATLVDRIREESLGSACHPEMAGESPGVTLPVWGGRRCLGREPVEPAGNDLESVECCRRWPCHWRLWSRPSI